MLASNSTTLLKQVQHARRRSRFEFSLAGEQDEPELRALLRATPVEGSIRVAFEREPNFFAAAHLQSLLHQVIIGRDTRTDRLIGMGTRSVSEGLLNGRPGPCGYLSDLRLLPEYRGGTLIARGYRVFRQLHEDRRAQLYYTVIFSDNATALQTIGSSRSDLPGYHDFGTLHCPAVNLLRPKPPVAFDGEIIRGSASLLPNIVACLNRNNRRKQFAPVHRVEDFGHAGRWTGFYPEDFYVALRNGCVAGVIGKWDLRHIKQSRVVGYRGQYRLLAPLLQMLAPLRLLPRLPRPGAVLPFFYACFIAVDDDDLATFRALLRQLYNDSVHAEFDYFLLALHESDPLNAALADYHLTRFDARLFCVCFPEDEVALKELDNRCPYIELATL